MSLDVATIERLVREVLREIEPQSAASRPVLASIPRVTAVEVPVAETPSATPVAQTVECTERVVTANWLQEQVPHGGRVRFTARAIVTPAAQDWLKQQRIPWDRGNTPASNTSNSPSVTAAKSVSYWKIIQQSTAGIATAAVKSIQQQSGVPVELCGTAAEAIVQGRSLICRGDQQGVIILTSQPQLVACQVNRQEQIRAVEVRDFREWSPLRQELNPNVVCINPGTKTLMELKHLLGQIVGTK